MEANSTKDQLVFKDHMQKIKNQHSSDEAEEENKKTSEKDKDVQRLEHKKKKFLGRVKEEESNKHGAGKEQSDAQRHRVRQQMGVDEE